MAQASSSPGRGLLTWQLQAPRGPGRNDVTLAPNLRAGAQTAPQREECQGHLAEEPVWKRQAAQKGRCQSCLEDTQISNRWTEMIKQEPRTQQISKPKSGSRLGSRFSEELVRSPFKTLSPPSPPRRLQTGDRFNEQNLREPWSAEGLPEASVRGGCGAWAPACRVLPRESGQAGGCQRRVEERREPVSESSGWCGSGRHGPPADRESQLEYRLWPCPLCRKEPAWRAVSPKSRPCAMSGWRPAGCLRLPGLLPSEKPGMRPRGSRVPPHRGAGGSTSSAEPDRPRHL